MMQGQRNAMRLQAQRALAEFMVCRNGQITNYDPDNYAVKVQLQPDGMLTGWLPLTSPWIGNQWGLFAAPSVGDMVAVEFIDGNLEAGFATMRFFNDEDRPLSVESGEFWLVHKSGSFLKFHNDGTVELTTHSDLTATVGGKLTANVTGDTDATISGKLTAAVTGDADITTNGNLNVTASAATINANTQVNGNLVVSGSIEDQNGAKGTVQHIRDIYDTHTHPGVQTGGGATAPTTQTL